MGPRTRQPAPSYYNQGYPDNPGYWDQRGYRDDGFAPFDAAAGVVDGAVNTAGAIATAPFRAMDGNRSYAMMQGDASYCASVIVLLTRSPVLSWDTTDVGIPASKPASSEIPAPDSIRGGMREEASVVGRGGSAFNAEALP